MDRAVLNEANLRNANLQRTIFTRCCLPPCTLAARMRWLRRLRVRGNSDQLDKRMRGLKSALSKSGGVCWYARMQSVFMCVHRPVRTPAAAAALAGRRCRLLLGAASERTSLPSPRAPCAHRSDLGGADIHGADFTNALLDKTQQIVRPRARRRAALCCFAGRACPISVVIRTREALLCPSAVERVCRDSARCRFSHHPAMAE
jgi:uncharacterized protein YjbI with pentapeptide repeats